MFYFANVRLIAEKVLAGISSRTGGMLLSTYHIFFTKSHKISAAQIDHEVPMPFFISTLNNKCLRIFSIYIVYLMP